MAKSVRASVSKRNKAKLRATVFGPAADARTERLSAKLQELAAQPKPERQQESKMQTEGTAIDTHGGDAKPNQAESNEEMDIDLSLKTGHSRRTACIQKRQRKNRSSIVFKPHPSKVRKVSRKK
ncbi:hypothetical protein BJX61DRAFT_251015 [Aspergillus egyptiacus]|nr:hypothetical protein BJX61DRAFT_251015 [Aspergillus egyptiacus]